MNHKVLLHTCCRTSFFCPRIISRGFAAKVTWSAPKKWQQREFVLNDIPESVSYETAATQELAGDVEDDEMEQLRAELYKMGWSGK